MAGAALRQLADATPTCRRWACGYAFAPTSTSRDISRDAQIILQALKKYGAIVADNGSPWYMSGVPDERWNNDVLQTLRRVPGSAFEAVDSSSLISDPNSGRVRGG